LLTKYLSFHKGSKKKVPPLSASETLLSFFHLAEKLMPKKHFFSHQKQTRRGETNSKPFFLSRKHRAQKLEKKSFFPPRDRTNQPHEENRIFDFGRTRGSQELRTKQNRRRVAEFFGSAVLDISQTSLLHNNNKQARRKESSKASKV
jgi:hypothetical protein